LQRTRFDRRQTERKPVVISAPKVGFAAIQRTFKFITGSVGGNYFGSDYSLSKFASNVADVAADR
jgi:hypothetical protein